MRLFKFNSRLHPFKYIKSLSPLLAKKRKSTNGISFNFRVNHCLISKRCTHVINWPPPLPARAFRRCSSSSGALESEGKAEPHHRCPAWLAIPAVHSLRQQRAPLERCAHPTARCLLASSHFLPFLRSKRKSTCLYNLFGACFPLLHGPKHFLHVYFSSAVNQFFRFD